MLADANKTVPLNEGMEVAETRELRLGQEVRWQAD